MSNKYWRLPTKEELYWLYLNKRERFQQDRYWSSAEKDTDNAWIQNFYSGMQDFYKKIYAFRVNPVRGELPDLELLDLKVYKEDLGEMTWYYAMQACEKLNKSSRQKWVCRECEGRKCTLKIDVTPEFCVLGYGRLSKWSEKKWHIG